MYLRNIYMSFKPLIFQNMKNALYVWVNVKIRQILKEVKGKIRIK